MINIYQKTIFVFWQILFILVALCIGAPAVVPVITPAADSSKEQRLSIDVKDTDIRDVVRMISKGNNLNILLDQDVVGKVTLHLSDVPIIEGLQSIAASNGLTLVKEGSVYKLQKTVAEQKNIIRYSGGKLTVDIQNVDVKEFLKELSVKTAASIVPDGKVSGLLTGKLFEVDLDDGLRALLEANGFKLYKRKNIYQVMIGADQGNVSSPPPMTYGRSPTGSRSNFYVDYTNGLLSVDVTNGDLEDIVRSITEQSDIQIITYGDIKTEINAKLSKVPLTEGLALLLGGTRFTFVQKGKVILIGDRNTATPSGEALSKSELIHLKHIKADNVPAILPKDIPPTNVRVIKEQNALLISGTSEDIVTAREFLTTIDIPTPQVRIDAVIVEYKENLDQEFGIRYGKDNSLINSSYTITPSPTTNVSSSANQFEMGASGQYIKNALAGSFGDLLHIKSLPDNFFVVLHFLESQDKAKILAQPSILTLNGNKASIDVSETEYFKISTGYGETYSLRFQPIKFGITLDITPWISQSGQITAEITPTVSNSENTNSDGYPNVSNRSITTTVRLNDGETLVLGGLIQNQESSFHHKIPLLGDIPLIGVLFQYSGKTRIKSNLVVYITPHVIAQDDHVDLSEELEREQQNSQNESIFEGKASGNKKTKSLLKKEPADSVSGASGKTIQPDISSAKSALDSTPPVREISLPQTNSDSLSLSGDQKTKNVKTIPASVNQTH